MEIVTFSPIMSQESDGLNRQYVCWGKEDLNL